MRATPFALVLTAALLTACSDTPEVDLAGRAAALARTVAAEQAAKDMGLRRNHIYAALSTNAPDLRAAA